MGLPGTIDSSTYQGLKDVLQRYPVVTTVTYEPDSIRKRSIRARIDPARISPPTGPATPTLDVEWRFESETSYYRIHYADPNTGFNCGWHRDRDHPDLGNVHFQYRTEGMNRPAREAAAFEQAIPTEILWTALERLFETHLPSLVGEE
ncbi:hypothetical protein SAMN05192561_101519 [Halopenitus malekzadehii]|uniref:Uncharacterized protein n=1 Tax=Halopenitus malekzadehii TaxID=1267564 RepID=A0A1H6HU25_9EURY|nr:hypothetical protein [Halopenitus malekzadehii]SEH39568.1 hypothetical protein SAMN05192561_101519 [Halopenitus malekzadehii]